MIRTRTLLFPLLLAAIAHADVTTLVATRDTTLFNDANGAVANGSGPVMIVGRAGGSSSAPVRRGLVRFDVAGALPAGSTVNSVQLVLNNTSGNTGARTVELHRVLADWGEGASNTTSGQGAASQPGDATWIHTFYPASLWSTAGGDFAAATSASLSIDPLGVHTFPSTAGALADVQGWLDAPATNFGWLLKLDVETVAQTTKVFGTRESANSAEWPRLVVDYTPPVTGYCVSGTSSVGCAVTIASSGTPSATAGSGFVVSLAHAPTGRATSLVYGLTGPSATPFFGATLCVAPPLTRSAVRFVDASDHACGGGASLDFNARIASGLDPRLAAGTVVQLQWHVRDAASLLGTLVASDALRAVIQP
ncbi:MAG: DNRLRE domain-containing protein [Planctomycetota bacterium]|nr:DNRLRE domain-containing protein [Planctomycetota bacterium]